MQIDTAVLPIDLLPAIRRMWEVSAPRSYPSTGRWTARKARRCTRWRDDIGRADGPTGRRASSSAAPCCSSTRPAISSSWLQRSTASASEMPAHVTHFGVHDHGFNQISTYGNLRRLVGEGRIAHDPWQMEYFNLALRCSGAVQAHRLTELGRRRSATSNRSTDRTRCSSTPCARSGCWRWPTSSGM